MIDNILLILFLICYAIFVITSIKLNLDEIENEKEVKSEKAKKLDELCGRSSYNQQQ